MGESSGARSPPMGRSGHRHRSYHEFLAGDEGRLLALGVDDDKLGEVGRQSWGFRVLSAVSRIGVKFGIETNFALVFFWKLKKSGIMLVRVDIALEIKIKKKN